MNTTPTKRRVAAMASAALAVAVMLGACSSTEPTSSGVTGAWARPTPDSATNAVVYLTLTTDTDDTLESVEVPDDIAEHATLHATSTTGDAHSGGHGGGNAGDVVTMDDIDDFPLSAGTPLEFSPGANHIMLTGLTAPLRRGDTFDLTLHLASAGPLTATVTVADQSPS